MSIREDFEAWLETESGYANKLITPVEKDAWWQAYKAATSRQEDKIKALEQAIAQELAYSIRANELIEIFKDAPDVPPLLMKTDNWEPKP